MRLCITIPVEPVAKGRPRFGKHGAYTPAKTRKAEEIIKAFLSPYDSFGSVPVCVDIMMLLPIPKSWSKKKQAAALAGEIEHTGRLDVDNLGKLALDAANGILWDDDGQIIKLTLTKMYSAKPGYIMIIEANP